MEDAVLKTDMAVSHKGLCEGETRVKLKKKKIKLRFATGPVGTEVKIYHQILFHSQSLLMALSSSLSFSCMYTYNLCRS